MPVQTLTPVDPSVYRARRKRLLDAARAAECSSVLIYGEGSARGMASHSHAAIRYLTGLDSQEAFSLLIITEDHDRLILSSPFMVPSAMDLVPELAPSSCTPDGWADVLRDAIGGRGRIGTVNFEDMPTWLSANVSVDDSVALDQALNRHRMIKDEQELASLRAGAAICDDLFQQLPGAMITGGNCHEIQVALENRGRTQGAGYCKTWLTVRPQADYPRYWPVEGTHVPEAGDQVLFGIALTVNGYWAHGIRMGAVGAISAAHHMLWQQVREMLSAGMDALNAGAPLSWVERVIDSVLASHYDADEISKMKRFRSGHGLGLSYEEPVLNDFFPQHFADVTISRPESEILVQPGMVFELHPNLFIPGIGGAAIGEMMVVSEEGAPERLLKTPTNPFLIPPI